MRQLGSSKWRWLGGVVVLSIAIVTYLRYSLSRHNPISLVGVSSWGETMDRSYYYFVDRNEILLFRKAASGIERAALYDLGTGDEKPWRVENRTLDVGGVIQRCLLSDDRRWLLLEKWHKNGDEVFVKSVLGSQEYHPSDLNCQIAAWTDDSQHWAEFLGYSSGKPVVVSVRIHSILPHEEPRNYPISSDSMVGSYAGKILSIDLKHNRFTYTVPIQGPGDQPSLNVITEDLETGKSLNEEKVLSPQSSAFIDQTAWSPDRKRIAWACSETTILGDPIHRLLARLHLLSRYRFMIYVTDSSGQNPRCIASVETTREPNSENRIEDVQWSPQGNALYYILNGRLWKIATD